MGTLISKPKKDKVCVEFVGGNAEGVTGSCTKISYRDKIYLFELGMSQDGNTVLETFKKNRKILQAIRPQEIDMVIVGHMHLDHEGLIPALFKNASCQARIIVPSKSTSILKEMWLDAAFINQRDAEYLTNKTGHRIEPLFTEAEVLQALEHVTEYPSKEVVQLDENLSIRFTPAGHILLSQQCELFVGKNHTRKILFTSDLGNLKIQDKKVFVEPFEPISTATIVIGEATYSARERGCSKKDVQKDIEKIRSVIDQYCVDNHHRVLIPVFSLDRTPYMLWLIYNTFKDDPSFTTIPVLVDSPLAIRLLNCYSSILDGEQKKQFDEMMNWKNLKLIISPEDSRAAISDKGAKVILSSSGMLTAGRSVYWTTDVLTHSDDCILFCGYAGPDTLAYRIKNGKEQKTITINGKPCKNRCQIVDLKSFSSHMQRDDLINYYKGINCEKIYLVHSDPETKLEFKEDLQNALSDCLKSTRVVAANKSTKISI